MVAGVTSPWARRRKISLAELADAPWILPANSWNWWRVEEAFGAIGKNMPNAMVDTVSVALRQQLLATGRFVAAIPASTLRSNIHKGLLKVLPVVLPNKPWPVVMVTLKHRTLSPAVQQFVELARIRRTPTRKSTRARHFDGGFIETIPRQFELRLSEHDGGYGDGAPYMATQFIQFKEKRNVTVIPAIGRGAIDVTLRT